MTESTLTQATSRCRIGRVYHDTAGRTTRVTFRGYVEPADGSNDYAVPCCGGFDGHRTPDAAKKCAEKAWRRLPTGRMSDAARRRVEAIEAQQRLRRA